MQLPFRVEERKSFRVVGYVIETTNKKKEGRKMVPAQWETFKNDNLSSELMPLMNQEPYGLLGISVYNIDMDDARKFHHYIAVSSNATACDGMDTYVIPEMTWAVFPCTVDTIGKTEAQAITKWLPKSDYRPVNTGYITGRMKSGAPDIEVYGEHGDVEVWVAVKKK